MSDAGSADEAKSAIQVYVGATYHTTAFPSSFQRRIDRKIGFWPGPPGRNFLEMGLNEEDFFVIAKRLSEYLKVEVYRDGKECDYSEVTSEGELVRVLTEDKEIIRKLSDECGKGN